MWWRAQTARESKEEAHVASYRHLSSLRDVRRVARAACLVATPSRVMWTARACACACLCVYPPLVPQIFSKLIGIARASGRATNAERDLEARADQLQASTSARNMERLLEDLAQVRKENAEIKAALKAAKAR